MVGPGEVESGTSRERMRSKPPETWVRVVLDHSRVQSIGRGEIWCRFGILAGNELECIYYLTDELVAGHDAVA